MNVEIGGLKHFYGVGNPKMAEQDWPDEDEAVLNLETKECLLPEECAVLLNNMARELLSLRTGEWDEEVEKLIDSVNEAISVCDQVDTRTSESAEAAFDRIMSIMTSIGQQLRESQAEVDKWRKRAEWLGSCYKDKTVANGRIVIVLDGTKSATYPDDADTIAKLMDNAMKEGANLSEGLQTSKQQIANLTAERDLLQLELDRVKGQHTLASAQWHAKDVQYRSQIEDLQSQLAAMQAGSVEEVDALYPHAVCNEEQSRTRKACDLARTFHSQIAERDRLLDHILSCIITVKQDNTPEWMEYIAEEVNKINKAMNDRDRVEVFCNGIRIVAASDAKSESEVGT